MANVTPFKGITYNQKKVKNLNKILAPPYDVISEDKQGELYMQSSFNIIRLILGKDLPHDSIHDNKYIRAKQYIDQWLNSEILIQEEKPCFYIYAQDYTLDRHYTRWGFIGLYHLNNKSGATIFPHEKTHSAPKKDRLNLLNQVETNLSPIFTLFSDTNDLTNYIRSMCERWNPYIDVEIDNVRNRLWKLRDTVSVRTIQETMEEKHLFIADGHHRLEVAREYQKLMRKEKKTNKPAPYDYVMMYYTSLEQPGLSILPTHRLIKVDELKKDNCCQKIKEFFKIEKYKSLEKLKNDTDKHDSDEQFLIMFDGKSYDKLVLKKDSLSKIIKSDNKISDFIDKVDVLILDQVLFKNCLDVNPEDITYTISESEAIDKVKTKEFDAAFILSSLKIDLLKEIVKTGEKLPPKTTFFYPKLTTGLTMYKF